MECRIGYVIVGVSSLDKAVEFYRDTMGFELMFCEPEFHFASFKVGDMRFSLAEGAKETHGEGHRNTGIGFEVTDLDATHADLAAKGVRFTMGPGKMPWGRSMAMFLDPDENEFYLDQAE